MPALAWRLVDGAPVAVDDAPASPGADDVGIEVEAAWIARDVRRADVVAGSAAVGTVVDAGERARGLIGTRVLVAPHLACGECEVCRRGGAAVCPSGGALGVDRRGTLASHVTVPARHVVSLAEDLAIPGPAAAAVAGDVLLAYALYARAGIGPRAPAVVLGDDATARFLVEILAAKGVTAGVARDAATATTALAAQGYAGKPLTIFATTDAGRPIALELAGPRAMIILRVAPGSADPGLALTGGQLAHELAVHAVVGAHPDLLTEVAALVVRGEVTLAGAVDVVAVSELAAALATPTDRSLVVTPDR